MCLFGQPATRSPERLVHKIDPSVMDVIQVYSVGARR